MHWNILLIVTMNQGRSDKIAVFLLKATAQKPMNEKRIETPSAVQSYEEKTVSWLQNLLIAFLL